MNEPVEIKAGLEFGPEQFATFAPILPVIESFAHEHAMKLSRVFDKDPLCPAACYFLTWARCFIRVSAIDPFAVIDNFAVVVQGPRCGFKNKRYYCIAEGGDRLKRILQEAKSLADQAALTPEEEKAHRELLQRRIVKMRQLQSQYELIRNAPRR